MMTSIIIGQSQRDKETREPDDAISITSGSEEGREKRPAMDLARGLSSAKWDDDGSLWRAFVASVRHLAVEKQLDLGIPHGDGTNTVATKGAMWHRLFRPQAPKGRESHRHHRQPWVCLSARPRGSRQ